MAAPSSGRVPHSFAVLRMSGIIKILLLPLDILGRFYPGRGRLVIGLTASLVSGAELLFLLVEHVASAIHPVTRLFACPTSVMHALARCLPAPWRE